jgi:hypothetical protein
MPSLPLTLSHTLRDTRLGAAAPLVQRARPLPVPGVPMARMASQDMVGARRIEWTPSPINAGDMIREHGGLTPAGPDSTMSRVARRSDRALVDSRPLAPDLSPHGCRILPN